MAQPRRLARQADWRKHFLARGMWAGSNALVQQELFTTTATNGTTLQPVIYHPLLWKIIDEIVVNAVDQHITYPTETTQISINFADGWITVENNGPGIPVEMATNQQGQQMYQPQLMFTEFLAGSNFDDLDVGDEQAADRIVGGQNGIGAKLTVVWSTKFCIETVDQHTGKHYIQHITDNAQNIEPPKITAAGRMRSKTIIKFLPDYARMSIMNGPDCAEQVTKTNASISGNVAIKKTRRTAQKFADSIEYASFAPTLAVLLETRAYQVAAYAAPNLAVTFNGRRCSIPSFAAYCAMLKPLAPNALPCYTVTMRGTSETQKKYAIDVCFAVSDGQPRQISFVNGIYTYDGGSLVRSITTQLVTQTKKYIERQLSKFGQTFSKTFITNNAMLIIRAQVPDPEFTSQTKSVLGSPAESYFADYQLTDREWANVWAVYEPIVQQQIIAGQMGAEKSRTTKKIKAEKYREANLCGKRGSQCGLFLCEGDSAIGTINHALLAKISPDFSYEQYGYYSVQGVIVNALKESTAMSSANNGTAGHGNHIATAKKTRAPRKSSKASTQEPSSDNIGADVLPDRGAPIATATPQPATRRIPGAKLLNSERCSTLFRIINLDFNKTYETDAEFATLRYQFIVILTDQDLDGYNISSLICVLIATFWPALVARQFIRRMFTPLLRFYPKRTYRTTLEVQEFYSRTESQRWIDEKGGDWVAAHYEEAKYYKGLAGHVPAYGEVDAMFVDAQNKTSIISLDADAIKTMHIYYADDTQPRKVALSTAVESEPEFARIRPMSEQFNIDTKLFQRDNIVRKLLCAMDGFVASRRKIFYGLRQLPRRDIRVASLAGAIINECAYHHGEASLCSTIIRMAQAYPAARNLPLLMPIGNFGSRAMGYSDAGAPRYIDTRLNWRLADALFKTEDEWLLDYVLEEGKRYEPVHYCPIIPYVICESNEIPATGWNMYIVARDVHHVIEQVECGIKAIEQGKEFKCAPLPMWRKDFHGTIRRVGHRNYSVGHYEVDQANNTVHITEIPFGTTSNAITLAIESKELVEDVQDNTTTAGGIDIIVRLKPAAIAQIMQDYGKQQFDCFEQYFGLYEPIYDRINLVDHRGNVVEYSTYEQVFDDWFKYRTAIYKRRIERELIVKQCRMIMLENKQRFAAQHATMRITSTMTEEQICHILERQQPPFAKLNSALINNPRFEAVETLREKMLCGSYDYLLDMSYRQMTAAASAERLAEIEKIKQRIAWLQTDPAGLKTWTAELAELKEQINEGLRTDWFYGENQFIQKGLKGRDNTKTAGKAMNIRRRAAR